jgi:hypothetical protein
MAFEHSSNILTMNVLCYLPVVHAISRLDGARGREVGRGRAAFESPAAVFAHKGVVVVPALCHHGFLVRAWNYESPSRPCSGRIAVHVDFEIR